MRGFVVIVNNWPVLCCWSRSATGHGCAQCRGQASNGGYADVRFVLGSVFFYADCAVEYGQPTQIGKCTLRQEYKR
jgi:hypothetical protein